MLCCFPGGVSTLFLELSEAEQLCILATVASYTRKADDTCKQDTTMCGQIMCLRVFCRVKMADCMYTGETAGSLQQSSLLTECVTAISRQTDAPDARC